MPLAVAVSQSSPIVPFKLPRDTIVLGWFWIMDAWTEQVDPPTSPHAVWKFRFEWCTSESEQKAVWWLPKDAPERDPVPLTRGPNPPVVIRGPGANQPTTIRGSSEAPQVDEEDGALAPRRCACNTYSDVVYEGPRYCLSEACEQYCRFSGDDSPETPYVPQMSDFRRLANHPTPEDYGLKLLPPDPSTVFADARREDAQRDFWRAWVCKRCRMANERRDWFGFLCEACSYLELPKRKVYTAEALRPPSRPVCTGPRPDEGYPSFGHSAVRSPATFPDSIKAITHNLDGDLGIGARLSHLLNHEGMSSVANDVLQALQVQGEDQILFRRHMLSAKSCRVSELALSPFYTFLVGPEPAYIPQLPCGLTTPWNDAPKATRDAIDLVNERCGRVCRDTKE